MHLFTQIPIPFLYNSDKGIRKHDLFLLYFPVLEVFSVPELFPVEDVLSVNWPIGEVSDKATNSQRDGNLAWWLLAIDLESASEQWIFQNSFPFYQGRGNVNNIWRNVTTKLLILVGERG